MLSEKWRQECRATTLPGVGGLLGAMSLESKTLRKTLTFRVYDLSANILGIEPSLTMNFESKAVNRNSARRFRNPSALATYGTTASMMH